jgi:transcriptional antiterminator RfaH
MFEPSVKSELSTAGSFLASGNKNWYVVYTQPKKETLVTKSLEQINIHNYLPMHTVMKQWSDRKKKVLEPLFKSYVFVYISKREFAKVLEVTNVMKFIKFEGEPAVVPDRQIEIVKKILSGKNPFSVQKDTFSPGDKVLIRMGQLSGYTGELVTFKNKSRVAIRLEQLGQTLLVDIPLYQLKLLTVKK